MMRFPQWRRILRRNLEFFAIEVKENRVGTVDQFIVHQFRQVRGPKTAEKFQQPMLCGWGELLDRRENRLDSG
jgi:hypothetical protein